MTPRVQRIIESLRHADTVRVLFVCLGNICRSPAAQGVLEDILSSSHPAKQWYVDSAGTGNYHIGDLPDKRMRVHARRRGIELTHPARQVRRADFGLFDLIIPMDSANEYDLMQLAATTEEQELIVPIMEFCTLATTYDHVPDPYYSGADGFELVLDLLQNACAALFNAIESRR